MSQPPPLHFPPEYLAQRRPNDVPIPTDRDPPRRQPTRGRSQSNAANLRRAKTLTRPERGIAPAPLINPPLLSSGSNLPSNQPTKSPADSWDTWRIFSHIVTFWAPPFLLSSIAGLKDKPSRQAWREKVALCFIAIILGGTVGFATMGLDRVLCPQNVKTDLDAFAGINSTDTFGTVGIQGMQFNITSAKITQVNWYTIAQAFPGQDVTLNFTRTAADFPLCKGLSFKAAKDEPCDSTVNKCVLGQPNNATFSIQAITPTGRTIGYDWDHVSAFKYYLVIDGAVLNFESYIRAHPSPVANDLVDTAIRTVLSDQPTTGGKDGTKLFYNRAELQQAIPCLVQRYYAGNIDKISAGCFISTLFLYVSLVVIMGIVFARFAMACVFNWFMSSRLIAAPKNLNRRVISPAVMPEGANINVDSRNGTAPWAVEGGGGKKLKSGPKASKLTLTTALTQPETTAPVISMATIGDELFCVCLVTCYSEGEESIRSTLDSISMTAYSDTRKLLFVVCDGMITGAGEKRSTPDICVGLLEADPRFGNPAPMSYVAVGLGAKRENRAMVYAGHYMIKGKRTPAVVLVKCGTEAEAMNDKKPGNRGKRDSQLVLMNFFSRVTYNDRMTPLDYDLFRKVQVLMGVTPDYFEVCLMVDADTKVLPDSLTYLVNCMHHDNLIMGVCGETRIANKRQSWVTAIQVYEYFISHHLAKAFESVFGGVTCLPGCFSMYRLKARKTNEDDWVPLLVKPEIVREYSQSEVTTLHQKNLLLLGEDRFLTTILLRTFPNRKMMFCPQAKCRTVAPDAFAVLLSQRRRWINSTIHNLMELVRVRNLCGTFCFSMQFVVFMDLLGTVVLPVAISLTYALVVSMVLNPPNSFEKAIPLMLLATVIGLPAVLILITTRKIVYVFWMLVYLAALPIWNFVLPVYSFWHFDDFSWGETRRVEGEGKQKGHDEGVGALADGTQIPMRRWEDWERSRLRKLRREEKRKRDLERSFPGAGGFLTARHHSMAMSDWNDDTVSVSTSEEDQWGTQIGAYNENASQWAPPPVALVLPHDGVIQSAQTLGGDELEAMLEQGFEVPARPSFSTNSAQSSPRRGPSTLRYLPNEGPTMTSSSSVTLTGSVYPPSRRDAANSSTNFVGRSPLSAPGTPIGSNSASSSWNERNVGEQEGMMGVMSPVEWGPLGPLDPAHNPQPNGSGSSGGKLQRRSKPAPI